MPLTPPTPPTPLAGGPSPAPRRKATHSLYGMQVRAFVEAAEVVDADPEVIEDILDGFLLDDSSDDAEDEDADVDVEGGPGPGTTVRDEESDIEDDPEQDEFAAYLEEAQTAWTAQEVKEMKYLLKEHGMAAFVNEYVIQRTIPIPKLLYAFGVCLCKELRMKQRRTLMYFLRVALSRELESRERLLTYNTIDDVVNLIKASKRILILTGAGISVSCGIPDFRSRNGLYASLQENGEYDLDDPQQMFDIQYFRENPAVFYSFASKIYPSNFIPSPCHRFIKLIEDNGKLLRNYTQNIDTLETLAGVQRVVQCHGSFATASCINCKVRVPGSEIADDIMNQRVPVCKVCNVPQPPLGATKGKKKGKKRKDGWDSDASDEPEPPLYPPGIMKPDITFFGEKLDDVFDRSLLEDRGKVDLLIIIGTSLKVSPVSDTISHLPHSVPQILINKTPVRHINPDVVLLGNADDIILHLCQKLGWDLPEPPLPTTSTHGGSNSGSNSRLNAPTPNLRKRPSAEFEKEPRRVGNSHVWLFEGAEGGKWVEEIERKYQQTASESTSAAPTPLSSPPASEVGDTRQMKKARVH
ncbi:SIR2-domain-containing protein [Dichomitus squalens LYAD-421 SS1]|uniref:SIR2-domain-containing protein n=1 Tax=Dichomitus squalens (strain LYAD-421) TaxID=732165 RepID=UPI0004410974|nr:SIR2-domain-containing protein [Dichomitus squalens LYAD-421 SS1]EJF64079.1 SIR2-domain-containing protein [Dichomitus squalens LYAD-421 SS1]